MSAVAKKLASLVVALLWCAAPATQMVRAQAIEWTPAAVRLSDGRELAGEVYIVGGRVLLMNEAQKRRYSIRIEEMARFESVVEKEGMEEKWIFKESGLNDKVMLGQYYPVRDYMTHVTFHDGRKLSGHIIAATLYVKSGGEKQRFILRRQNAGKVDQKPEDLLHVKEIVFGGAGGVRGTISGRMAVPAGETLKKVVAVNRTKLVALEGEVLPAVGSFRFTDCTAGTYDLVALTDRAIYVFFSRELDEGARRLDAGTVAEINEWYAKIREFFHESVVVYGGGEESQAFVLVRMERLGGTTSKQVQMVRRYEVWALHMPGQQWQIEKRFFLDRVSGADLKLARRQVRLCPALGGHKVSAENADLQLDLQLEAADERLVPPAPPEEER